jgi:hypothetical protein
MMRGNALATCPIAHKPGSHNNSIMPPVPQNGSNRDGFRPDTLLLPDTGTANPRHCVTISRFLQPLELPIPSPRRAGLSGKPEEADRLVRSGVVRVGHSISFPTL